MRKSKLNLIDALYLGHMTANELLNSIDNFDEFLETCTTKDDLLCVLQALQDSENPELCEQIQQKLNNQ